VLILQGNGAAAVSWEVREGDCVEAMAAMDEVRPYYDDGTTVIYHGDWHEVVSSLPLAVDALVTDPPYGIRADEEQTNRAGKQYGGAVAPSRDYGHSEWDHQPPSAEDFERLLGIGRHHVFWGGNHFALPAAPGWLVWDKETGTNRYADCELAWTDLPMAVRRLRFQWMGMIQRLPEERVHPTQKPVPVMHWVLGLLPDTAQVILDCFMGSGSTLRAAKDLGLRSIGIEIEERYCEIAVERLAQECLDFRKSLF
jgi:site-specific DNA-methyltransferase (adenine-specific)